VGGALADQALADVAGEVGAGAGDVLVVNGRPATRSGVIEVTVPAGADREECFVGVDGIPRAVQLLDVTIDELFAARVAGEKVGWVADRIVGGTFDGHPVRHWALSPDGAGADGVACLRFSAAGLDDDVAVALDDARAALLDLGRAGAPVRVVLDGPPRRRVLVETGPVPGYGWTTLRRPGPSAAGAGADPAGIPVRVSAGASGGAVLDNGLVRVEIDPDDGTFAVTTGAGLRVEGLNRYVDGGDGGDTYTWCPPALDTVVDRPTSLSLQVEENGPLRGRVVITAGYRWPAEAVGDERACSARSADPIATSLVTAVSLTAGDPVVAVETALDNRARDHRLRAHFPLPAAVKGADAGCAFAVVRRPLDVESGPAETPPPTFPARRFVDCSDGRAGLAVIADGTFEYEVAGDGRELAVTLLRATGWLSRRRLPARPDPAGPAVPVEGAQLQGLRRWRFGVLLHAGGWDSAGVADRADAFLNPFEALAGPAATGAAGSARPAEGRALTVSGAEVSSVVRDDDGAVAVRLFNSGSGPVPASVGHETVVLRPGEIATVRAGPRPPAG